MEDRQLGSKKYLNMKHLESIGESERYGGIETVG